MYCPISYSVINSNFQLGWRNRHFIKCCSLLYPFFIELHIIWTVFASSKASRVKSVWYSKWKCNSVTAVPLLPLDLSCLFILMLFSVFLGRACDAQLASNTWFTTNAWQDFEFCGQYPAHKLYQTQHMSCQQGAEAWRCCLVLLHQISCCVASQPRTGTILVTDSNEFPV